MQESHLTGLCVVYSAGAFENPPGTLNNSKKPAGIKHGIPVQMNLLITPSLTAQVIFEGLTTNTYICSWLSKQVYTSGLQSTHTIETRGQTDVKPWLNMA